MLPLATGGSLAHLLALDYALKPVLAALGARDILDGVYATEAQLVPHEPAATCPTPRCVERLDRALQPLLPRRQAERDVAPDALAPTVCLLALRRAVHSRRRRPGAGVGRAALLAARDALLEPRNIHTMNSTSSRDLDAATARLAAALGLRRSRCAPRRPHGQARDRCASATRSTAR